MKNPANTLFCIAVAIFAITLSPAVTMGYEKEISSLAESLKGQIQSSGKKKVAVVDFTDLQGSINELGRFLAEELSTGLLEAKGTFEVIDRSSLQSLLKENKLSATGLIDPKDTQKIVKVSGVDALITGSITSSSDSMRLSVKILDAETAKLIGASKANLPATDFLKDLEKKGVSSAVSYSTENSTGDSAANKPTEFKVQSKAEEKGFVFALQGCKKKGSDLKCEFLITSIENDKHITIYGNSGAESSYIFDVDGNSFYPERIVLGNDSFDKKTNHIKLYKNTPIKMIIKFSETANVIEVIKMLVINCSLNIDEQFVVKFQNINIDKTK